MHHYFTRDFKGEVLWMSCVDLTPNGHSSEAAIVSVLREVIVKGVLEIPWTQTLSACAFLLVMGIGSGYRRHSTASIQRNDSLSNMISDLVVRIWLGSIGEQA
jgi:hypothetical protein